MKANPCTIRVLTVTDLHQRRVLYEQLEQAVREHRPDAVLLVGDMLEALEFATEGQLEIGECAQRLAGLPVAHVAFARGNHEHDNWTQFVAAWPHEQRPLLGLHGSSYAIGPLVVVGFPCHVGSEFTWCSHLSPGGNQMELAPAQPRESLPSDPAEWLPALLRQLGPAGLTLGLMHEPPMGRPLASVDCALGWKGRKSASPPCPRSGCPGAIIPQAGSSGSSAATRR